MTKTEKLKLLSETISQCKKCELSATRTQIVMSRGNPDAKILCVAEAPGTTEDKTGIVLVGRAGQLLDKIIAAAGWTENDVYLANILKCHPPGNATPTAAQAACCRPFLDLQVKLINPKYIICLGKVAAFHWFNLEGDIDKFRMSMVRGKVHDYQGRKVIATYHPAYLLRNPAAKEEVWNDVLLLKSVMS